MNEIIQQIKELGSKICSLVKMEMYFEAEPYLLEIAEKRFAIKTMLKDMDATNKEIIYETYLDINRVFLYCEKPLESTLLKMDACLEIFEILGNCDSQDPSVTEGVNNLLEELKIIDKTSKKITNSPFTLIQGGKVGR